jgi:predicted GNAT family N-acyltransferase
MKVRIAEMEDFNQLDKLQKEAATRLKNQGSSQWSEILTNDEQRNLLTRLESKELLLIEEENQLVGMCYLYTQPNDWDFSLWKREENKKHYYLHKLVIGDLFVGNNYGAKVLSNVIKWVKENEGEKVLLDCRADVSYLNNFYRKSGFKFIETVKADEVAELFGDFNLYEYLIR